MQLVEHFLPVPTGMQASILLDERSAMASVPLQNLQSQRYRVKERTEAMLLRCNHNLSPKLAQNHGFRASCVYSVLSALHLKLARWLSLKRRHLYPLTMPGLLVTHRVHRAGQPCCAAASLPPPCQQTRWPNTQAPDWAQSQLHSATRKQSQTSSVSATVQQ